jgi:hypothetical protein
MKYDPRLIEVLRCFVDGHYNDREEHSMDLFEQTSPANSLDLQLRYRNRSVQGWIDECVREGLLKSEEWQDSILYVPTDRGVLAVELHDEDQRPATVKRPRFNGVNARMLTMLRDDLDRVAWPASKWATALGCTAANVKQTKAWETIMTQRKLAEADRVSRARGKLTGKAD